MPFTVNLHEKAGLFGRFNAAWTPAVLILSPRGAEVRRIEGYLPRDLFVPELEMGAAKSDFVSKGFASAERWYDHIAREHPAQAAEALYWRAVSRYSASHDPAPLGEVAQELRERFPDSLWTTKASVWAQESSG